MAAGEPGPTTQDRTRPDGEPPGSVPLAVTVAALSLLQLWLSSHLVPIPMTDEGQFKGLAYELAVHGRWALPLARGYQPGIETHFYPYPPLFFLVLAGWFKVLGVGPVQNHAFVSLLRLVGSALGGALAARLSQRHKGFAASLACLAIFSYGRLDRPDHLASLSALAVVWLVAGEGWSRGKAVALAVAAAAALSTVPAATVLYLVLFAVFALRPGVSRTVLRVWLWAFLLVGVIQVLLLLRLPDLYWRFLRMCYWKVCLGRGSFLKNLLSLHGTVYWVPWFALLLALAQTWLRRTRQPAGRADIQLSALCRATAASLAVWALMAPGTFSYAMLLYPFAVAGSVASLTRLTGLARRSALAGAFLALLAGWIRPGMEILRVPALAPEDRYGFAAAAVALHVPPGSVVMGDGALWTMLIGPYELYDLTWGARQISRARYVVSMGYGTGRAGVSTFESGPLWAPDEFRLVFDGLRPDPQRLFGVPLGRSRLGYGIRIFERKRATPSTQPSPDAR